MSSGVNIREADGISYFFSFRESIPLSRVTKQNYDITCATFMKVQHHHCKACISCKLHCMHRRWYSYCIQPIQA